MDDAAAGAATAPDANAEVGRRRSESWSDSSWLLRVLGVVVVFALIAWARSHQLDIPFKDPHGKLFVAKLSGTAAYLAVAIVLDVLVRWWRARRTGVGLWRTACNRWTPYRLLTVAAGLLAYFVVYFCYRNLKSWDVFRAPRDAMLERWDHWLFFGHSPAVLLHDLLGQDLAAQVLTHLYESFSNVVTLALVAALAFTPTVRSAYVFVVSAMWAWILGVGTYYLIPSLGPFHQSPQDFAGLTRTSIQATQALYIAQRDQLLAHPHATDAFAQVSAFASLHCGLTFLIFLMARWYGLRVISWAAGLFVVCTLVATVYLGWHFAVDDLAGLALAWVAVQLGKLTVLGSAKVPHEAVSAP